MIKIQLFTQTQFSGQMKELTDNDFQNAPNKIVDLSPYNFQSIKVYGDGTWAIFGKSPYQLEIQSNPNGQAVCISDLTRAPRLSGDVFVGNDGFWYNNLIASRLMWNGFSGDDFTTRIKNNGIVAPPVAYNVHNIADLLFQLAQLILLTA